MKKFIIYIYIYIKKKKKGEKKKKKKMIGAILDTLHIALRLLFVITFCSSLKCFVRALHTPKNEGRSTMDRKWSRILPIAGGSHGGADEFETRLRLSNSSCCP